MHSDKLNSFADDQVIILVDFIRWKLDGERKQNESADFCRHGNSKQKKNGYHRKINATIFKWIDDTKREYYFKLQMI